MTTREFGSDVVVRALERLGIEYVALNPGASFRGIHDSLVASRRPEPVLALHEAACVAIAHGYAKAAGRPMVALVHNLVGLQNAAMAIFNAWGDDAPVMVLGGSGPADTTRRRPWLDWVHTANQQVNVVRDHLKWDAQPASLDAVPEALARAHSVAITPPHGPTYVAIDALIQEQEIAEGGPFPPTPGPLPVSSFTVPDETLTGIAAALAAAHRPVLIADGSGRSRAGYEALIRIAERLAAPVVDLGARHSFPNRHVCDATDDRVGVLARADVVLALDPRDLSFAIGAADHDGRGWQRVVDPAARVLAIGLNQLLHRGFLEREPVIPDAELAIGDTAIALPRLADLLDTLDVCDRDARWAELKAAAAIRDARRAESPSVLTGGIHPDSVARALWGAVRGGPWQLAFPAFRGWFRRSWDLSEFNAVLGGSGGAGLGYGPGAAVGAGLAHRSDDTLVVSLQPDGDLLYGAQALWTAANQQLPMVIVVENNRSYGADRLHQQRVARARGRGDEGVHVGIDIVGPAVDIAGLARALGLVALGPVERAEALPEVMERAVRVAREDRAPVLVDVIVARPSD